MYRILFLDKKKGDRAGPDLMMGKQKWEANKKWYNSKDHSLYAITVQHIQNVSWKIENTILN